MSSLREKAGKKWEELKTKAKDKDTQRRIKAEIKKRFGDAKKELRKLEKEVTSPKFRAKAVEQIKQAKEKVAKLKAEFTKRQQQAKEYTVKNPQKALAIAAAAGALVGALYVVVRRKK